MSHKRTVTPKKKLVWLVAGAGLVAGGFTAATSTSFASQDKTATSAPQRTVERTFRASVISGVQIYACTKQADGTFAFTQRGVRATLQGGIKHSFVNPDSGPPQWVARDGSAVTGTVISKTPGAPGNIPELELKATQSGRTTGKLAEVVKIRRLNTRGGTAPAGVCDPAATPTKEVPYHADYEFTSLCSTTPAPTPPGTTTSGGSTTSGGAGSTTPGGTTSSSGSVGSTPSA